MKSRGFEFKIEVVILAALQNINITQTFLPDYRGLKTGGAFRVTTYRREKDFLILDYCESFLV